jgi:Putative peptidoglycan binding domain
LQTSEDEGSVTVIRQTPGAAPAVVTTDTADGNALPREVAAELDAIFGAPDTEAAEASRAPEALRVPEASAAIAAATAPGQVCKRLFDKARALSGHLSSRNGPGGGRLACVWALNKVAQQALGRPIINGNAVVPLRALLAEHHFATSEAKAPEGAIIISTKPGSTDGHVGIVGEGSGGGRKIYSNSSSRAMFMQNYKLADWTQYFHNQRAMRVEFFELNPRYFPGGGGGHPYPGTPLQQGSRGEDVRTVQQRLNQLGNKLETDGIFGPATHQAVVAFQKKQHLTADGIVGPQTWAALWR